MKKWTHRELSPNYVVTLSFTEHFSLKKIAKSTVTAVLLMLARWLRMNMNIALSAECVPIFYFIWW